MEALVFSSHGEVDRLLDMLGNLDATQENLAENEELSVCVFPLPPPSGRTLDSRTGVLIDAAVMLGPVSAMSLFEAKDCQAAGQI